ncbi:cation transporter, partial [Phenylobacterium sp.]
MRTTTVDVSGFRTPLDPLVIEKHLRRHKGVRKVAANFASASATVTYDEALVSDTELEQAVRDCGFHCAGQVVPRHVCAPGQDAVSADARHDHAHNKAAPSSKAASKAQHADHGEHDAMADMGHGPGMDMQAMARDMRNRFLVALAFTVPIFFLAPMGMDFLRVNPP